MMRRKLVVLSLAATFAALVTFEERPVIAQTPVAAAASPKPVKCRIKNNTGLEVHVKIVGYQNQFDRTFKIGETYMTKYPKQYLMEGQRVVIAFDELNGEVVATKQILIDGPTHIEVDKGAIATSTLKE